MFQFCQDGFHWASSAAFGFTGPDGNFISDYRVGLLRQPLPSGQLLTADKFVRDTSGYAAAKAGIGWGVLANTTQDSFPVFQRQVLPMGDITYSANGGDPDPGFVGWCLEFKDNNGVWHFFGGENFSGRLAVPTGKTPKLLAVTWSYYPPGAWFSGFSVS